MPELSLARIVPVALGAALLFFGRRIFWLFVGGVVFVVTMATLPRFMHHQESLIFYIALGAGVLAAAAGYFVQKVASRIAGFLAGGFFGFILTEQYFPQLTAYWWLPALIGALIGLLVVSFLVDWALILLSSFIGAYLISESLNLEATPAMATLALLAILGVVVQARSKRGKKTRND